VVDRNIRHFLWYGGVGGDGLRSVGEEALPSSKSVCSILPIALCGPGLSGAPAFIYNACIVGRVVLYPWPSQRGLRFAPLCVARDLGRCDHDYPRWDAHTMESIVTSPVLGALASIMGSELLQAPL
jgi:hypothetical protein